VHSGTFGPRDSNLNSCKHVPTDYFNTSSRARENSQQVPQPLWTRKSSIYKMQCFRPYRQTSALRHHTEVHAPTTVQSGLKASHGHYLDPPHSCMLPTHVIRRFAVKSKVKECCVRGHEAMARSRPVDTLRSDAAKPVEWSFRVTLYAVFGGGEEMGNTTRAFDTLA